MSEQALHVRSTSMPSASHPTTIRIKEELQNLRTNLAVASSPSASTISTEMVCRRLKSVGSLYHSIQDLLHLPNIQQGICKSSQRKWLEDNMDESLIMLEICATMKEAVLTLKEHIQELQFELRRTAESSIKQKAQIYHQLRKETQKIMKKSRADLKNLHSKYPSSPLLHEDSNLSDAIKELHEAREVAVAVLLSVSSFMSSTKTKVSKWSFASKAMLTKKIACEEVLSEMSTIDAFLCDPTKDINKSTAALQDQLEVMKNGVADLESGFDCLYQALIQYRVSILNILSF